MKASDVKEEGRRLCEDIVSPALIVCRIDAMTVVMWTLYWSVVVKRELSVKAEFIIYWPIYVPSFTYGDELWIVTKRTKVQIKSATMSFL